MAIVTPPEVTPTPLPAPQRGDRTTFSSRVDTFVTWLVTAVTQFNALSINVFNNATEAKNSATASAASAQISSTSRTDAGVSAATALAAQVSASASAVTATDKAAAALAAANAAAAIQGIPTTNGNNSRVLRVNAAGTGIEWAVSGDTLNYVPVQQGTGVGQNASAIMIGSTTAMGGLKASIDEGYGKVDLGFLMTSVTAAASGEFNVVTPIKANKFTGAFAGNGSLITGMTMAQIATALGYTPANAAASAPGAIAEIGRYLDFHSVNTANDFDARIDCEPPTGGSGTSRLTLSGGLHMTADFRCDSDNYSRNFVGSGAYLSGIPWGALPYTPLNYNNPQSINGGTFVSAGSNFDQNFQNVLTVQSVDGNNSANMQFLRVGVYGFKVGLDTNNTMVWGGWSQGSGSIRMSCDTSGNFTAAGNVTAYSDIRFKTEVKRMGGVLKKIRALELGGIEYLDTRTGEHKVGVSAQDVEKQWRYAINYDAKGIRSVAYGQLALPLVIESAIELEDKIIDLQAQIDKLYKFLLLEKN